MTRTSPRRIPRRRDSSRQAAFTFLSNISLGTESSFPPGTTTTTTTTNNTQRATAIPSHTDPSPYNSSDDKLISGNFTNLSNDQDLHDSFRGNGKPKLQINTNNINLNNNNKDNEGNNNDNKNHYHKDINNNNNINDNHNDKTSPIYFDADFNTSSNTKFDNDIYKTENSTINDLSDISDNRNLRMRRLISYNLRENHSNNSDNNNSDIDNNNAPTSIVTKINCKPSELKLTHLPSAYELSKENMIIMTAGPLTSSPMKENMVIPLGTGVSEGSLTEIEEIDEEIDNYHLKVNDSPNIGYFNNNHNNNSNNNNNNNNYNRRRRRRSSVSTLKSETSSSSANSMTTPVSPQANSANDETSPSRRKPYQSRSKSSNSVVSINNNNQSNNGGRKLSNSLFSSSSAPLGIFSILGYNDKKSRQRNRRDQSKQSGDTESERRKKAESYAHLLTPSNSLGSLEIIVKVTDYYDPTYLDDPKLKTEKQSTVDSQDLKGGSKHRTVLSLSGFMGSLMHHNTRPSDLKRESNAIFRQAHPEVDPSLTLSQIRKIKAKLLTASRYEDLDLELSTVAKAYAYFEKLTLKGSVTKYNRRLIGATCLLLASKVNEPMGMSYSPLLESLHKHLELTTKEITEQEFSVFSSLDFELYLPPSEFMPHFDRIFNMLGNNAQDYLGDNHFYEFNNNSYNTMNTMIIRRYE
ncbi:hypothetical protein Glove_123g39 [Diversispora epigaea]|uniref:Cyclin N-terminal domain-containing protein n=1 Tax=Diversispora epigaea TaxID=1348612 RepID=A0A397J566_9GLOM|nr:hypothetical protein Glove_123g39 [Diversispora epigaea]